MSLSGCLRSWMVLPVVGVLLGATAPLALCDVGRGQVRCAADLQRQAEAPDGCHASEAQFPAARAGCSDRVVGILPITSRTLTDPASAPLALAASPVDSGMPDEAAEGAIERTVLLTRHRPLFTLFSALLL